MRSPATLAALIAATFVSSLFGAADAEARGRRGGRVGLGVGVVAGGGSARAEAARRQAVAEPDQTAALRPILPVRAPTTAPAAPALDARSGGAWCGKQRVVGLGAGFCEIN